MALVCPVPPHPCTPLHPTSLTRAAQNAVVPYPQDFADPVPRGGGGGGSSKHLKQQQQQVGRCH